MKPKDKRTKGLKDKKIKGQKEKKTKYFSKKSLMCCVAS